MGAADRLGERAELPAQRLQLVPQSQLSADTAALPVMPVTRLAPSKIGVCPHFPTPATQEVAMTIMRAAVPAILMVGLLAFAGQGDAQTPQAKRPLAKPLIGLELAPEMESVQGRSLCMQLTTYEPGASNTEHSHKAR